LHGRDDHRITADRATAEGKSRRHHLEQIVPHAAAGRATKVSRPERLAHLVGVVHRDCAFDLWVFPVVSDSASVVNGGAMNGKQKILTLVTIIAALCVAADYHSARIWKLFGWEETDRTPSSLPWHVFEWVVIAGCYFGLFYMF